MTISSDSPDPSIPPALDSTPPGWDSPPVDPVVPPIIVTGRLALMVLGLAFFGWAFWGVGLNIGYLASNAGKGATALKQFFPPDWTILLQEWNSMLDTVQMAVVGTLLGAALALPISFFAARTTTLVRGMSGVIKTILNIFRAIPIVVYAIILASVIGLGKPTAALGIMIGTFVMLAKLYAEALESVAPGPVEAVRAAGGNTAQTFVFGMLPQVFPGYVSNTLYAFELNLQASFILGFVGAGGIGYDLLNYTRLFQYHQVCTVLFITIIVINMVDLISYRIRRAIS
ncbi:MAG TPA: phosphonate ABC transporter, permease protein PhnE [Armatimonadota bacterium]|nr:phosphonate ABC transporter, permease protein PhnE [Armatimonadota bacterium]